MKGKSLSIILIFSLALNFAVLGTFIFFKLNKPDFYRPDFDRLSPKGMNFNEEQREQMFKTFREIHDASRESRKLIRQLERELFELLNSNSPDSVAINLLVEKIGQEKTALSKLAIKKLLSSKQFLSKEQRMHFMQRILEDRRGPQHRPRERENRFKNRRESNKPQNKDPLK